MSRDGEQPAIVAVTGLAREARIAAGPRVRTIACGGDATYLAEALEREVHRGARGVISFGIAGSLRYGLSSGTWLIGERVTTTTARWHCDSEWTQALRERLPGAFVVDLAGSDALVTEPAAKRMVHSATRAAAVDMESHIVAKIAATYRLRFAAFRVVADPFDRSLPAAAAIALSADGTIDGVAVARSLMRRPAQIRSLVRTAIEAQTALRALSRGRRLLGPELGYPDLGELALDVR